MDDVFIQVDGLIIMTDFVVKVEDIIHDDFLLIWGYEEGVVLRGWIPMGQNVVFERRKNHGQNLRLLIWGQDKKLLKESWLLAVLHQQGFGLLDCVRVETALENIEQVVHTRLSI